jgi:hypothetical protein
MIFSAQYATGQLAKRFDILITEILADPTPSVGLPQSEFIEITNVSTVPFNLHDWRISDGNSTSVINANYILPPDSMIIICSNVAVSLYSSLAKVIGVSGFPSLDNDADVVYVRSAEGFIIHTVSYTKDWYRNNLKTNGGWSLEMIDSKNPCGGMSNWMASTQSIGGTPGRKNSVQNNNADDIAPFLLRTYSVDSTTIVAVFDEPIDSLTASNPSRYMLDQRIGQATHANPISPLFREIILKFPLGFSEKTVYHLVVSGIKDCVGNESSLRKVKCGATQLPDTSDIIINEILFNPKSDGFDFIELHNKSNKIIDLQELYVSNRNSTGSLINIHRISNTPYLFFPGDFFVLTEDSKWLNQNFIVRNPDNILQLLSLPTLPDDRGRILIASLQGTIIDELEYDEKWHFALIDNSEGISLERIDYNVPTQNKNNWTSAASTAGFGTPGYQNSQFRIDPKMQGSIAVDPVIFSPDNDGFNDLATIFYKMAGPGYVANITVYDAAGRAVRYLVKNATLGLEGMFRWDGLDDKSQRLPMGIYVVFTEIFNLQGKTKKFKNVLTLARRF